MITMPLKEVAEILAVALPQDKERVFARINTDSKNKDLVFTGISTDSRSVQPHNLFFALRGENHDAHEFVAQAQQKGAVAAVVDHLVECSLPQIHVTDTLQALGQLAKAWRSRFNLPIIAVTGSNGKTTTKNMLAAIFLQANQQQESAVLATQGNYNNAIGLPLTLARFAATHKHAIIEMGMNHFGELDYLTHLLQPTTAVITNVGVAHMGELDGTPVGVAKAKGEIFAGLPANGIGVINADDTFADYWRQLLGKHRVVTFGLKNKADVHGEILSSAKPTGHNSTQTLSSEKTTGHNSAQIASSEKSTGHSPTQTLFRLTSANQSIDILLNLPGEHNVMNALAASAAAIANGVQLNDIKIALEKIQAAPGRLQLKTNPNGVRIIDDTYNANPDSLKAAIQTLIKHAGTKILVLGDMRELGSEGEKLHHSSGEYAREFGIDYLLATGELSKAAVKAFGKNAFHFPDHASLIKALHKYLNSDTIILVKGSRSMKMEQVVNAILAAERVEAVK